MKASQRKAETTHSPIDFKDSFQLILPFHGVIELPPTRDSTATPDLSTSPTETSSEDWNTTLLNLTTPTSSLDVEPPEDKDSEFTYSGQPVFEAFLKISNLILLTLLVGIGCVVVDLYRKQVALTRHVQEELHQMKDLDNDYVDRPIFT